MKPRARTSNLADLGTLRTALRERQRAEEAERQAVLEREAAARRERTLFATSVGTVLPLRRPVSEPPDRPRPAPRARQRERDDQAVLVEAISDDFDPMSLLETDDALSFRRRGVGIDVVRKLRRGVWALQGELDLHGLRRDEARERMGSFLREAAREGHRCVRIVHGKGLGSPGREPVLKDKVKSWLAQRAEVMAFTHARPADGGHGALIVLLRSSTVD